jgi:hypothetical protein
MTLSTWTSTVNVTTDALWRTEMQAISTAILAVGLVQTADTGQINFATAVRSGVINTAVGYQIFTFNDTYQGSYPCYIKVEYGSGGVATTSCSLWITVGTGTNGAGVITPISTSRYQIQCSAATAGTFISGVSGSTSRLTLGWCTNGGTTVANWFTVERIQNSAGADTTTGLVFIQASRNLGITGNFDQVIYFTNPQPYASTSVGTMMINQPTATTWVVGTNTGTGPILPIGFGVHPAVQGGLTYFNADLTVGNQFTVSIYGNNHNFLAIGSANIGTLYNLQATASILTRWD